MKPHKHYFLHTAYPQETWSLCLCSSSLSCWASGDFFSFQSMYLLYIVWMTVAMFFVTTNVFHQLEKSYFPSSPPFHVWRLWPLSVFVTCTTFLPLSLLAAGHYYQNHPHCHHNHHAHCNHNHHPKMKLKIKITKKLTGVLNRFLLISLQPLQGFRW